jgi:DNA-directed RNA polymerase specialized sigma24 family protein
LAAKTDFRDWRLREDELLDALGIAEEFLHRWDDSITVAERDDLRVESALLAVQGWDRLRDKNRFAAYVRTIARRQRAQAVRQRLRVERVGLRFGNEVREELEQPQVEQKWFEVAGHWIQQRDMLQLLPDLLARLNPLNARLLMGYYEGFSCAELAGRFDISIDVVKVRIHRTRRLVKGLFELTASTESGELRIGTVPVRQPEMETADGRIQQERNATCDE